MAVRIKFDSSHNVIHPTFVLATRSGNKLGAINATDVSVSDSFNSHFELSFRVYKYDNNKEDVLWNEIKDFRLVWCREWDVWFELHVELQDDDNTVKNISCVSLGEAELSQIMLYNIEINTEDDILRDDYVPTVLFDDENHNGSLLHRIMEKSPHYFIKHVDFSIAKIQRTFNFNGISLYDALQDIADEINCIFIINSCSNEDGSIQRSISVFDLEAYCLDCGTRDNFTDVCPNCESNNVTNGYGEDTSIFISTDNLADEINFETDKDSVKNCFKLEAGDDLMTASIRNTNPNGSPYIWSVSDETKKDMSDELTLKLKEYDDIYDYYVKEHITTIDNEQKYILLGSNQTFTVGEDIFPGDILSLECDAFSQYYYMRRDGVRTVYNNGSISTTKTLEITSDMVQLYIDDGITAYIQQLGLLTRYNNLVEKYSKYSSDIKRLPESIIGYKNLMNAYYDMIDFYLFLNNNLMPLSSLPDTTAKEQASILSSHTPFIVAVQDLTRCSCATASNAVLAMVKTILDSRYQVKVQTSNLSDSIWTGSFSISNYADESDSVVSEVLQFELTDDLESYTKQRIEKTLNNSISDSSDIISMFDMDIDDFSNELKKYCLTRLISFHDACQACINILIEQGIANDDLWATADKNLYLDLYIPYYNKLIAIKDELFIREREIQIITGKYDSNDVLVSDGVQTFLEYEKDTIQSTLNFENYLGTELWLEFIAYRREDTYKNDNYISDGLNNRELLNKASEFIEVAKKEIFKSSTLQHSISASLKNLLVMNEFQPIVDYFCVGNWIRVSVDGIVYRLRLLSYTIDFENLDTISIEFSDVKKYANSISDTESILNQAASMATTYDAVTRQATQGNKSKQQLEDWVTKGLSLTKMKIVDSADNQNISWDKNGLLCREYLPITDTYSEKQLRIINRGLYLTDDNWLTSKSGIGDFNFYNPETKRFEESYGVIADTLIGNLILSEKVGVYNTNNSIVMDKNGIVITSEESDSDEAYTTFTIQRKVLNNDVESYEKILYIDSDGNLVLNGTIRINSQTDSSLDTLDDICDTSRFDDKILNTVHGATQTIYSDVDKKYQDVITETTNVIERYKADIGQFMDFGENGLTLGASTSNFKTVIDNRGMYFMEGNTRVSYVNNSQLYIPNAVIENALILGNFFFSPRNDGGVSLSWQGNKH